MIAAAVPAVAVSVVIGVVDLLGAVAVLRPRRDGSSRPSSSAAKNPDGNQRASPDEQVPARLPHLGR